jgi:hypothetical protein
LTTGEVHDSHQDIGGSMEDVSVKERIETLGERLDAFGRYL